ncbi:MAG: hypothetical protein ACRCUH_00370 [Shewanella sp.]
MSNDQQAVENISSEMRRDIVISELKRKSKVRKILKGLSLNEIREIVSRMQEVLIEYELIFQHKAAESIRKRDIAEKIITRLSDADVDKTVLNDLITKLHDVSSDKAVYMKDGVKWCGKGRRPIVFKGLSQIELEFYRMLPKRSK